MNTEAARARFLLDEAQLGAALAAAGALIAPHSPLAGITLVSANPGEVVFPKESDTFGSHADGIPDPHCALTNCTDTRGFNGQRQLQKPTPHWHVDSSPGDRNDSEMLRLLLRKNLTNF